MYVLIDPIKPINIGYTYAVGTVVIYRVPRDVRIVTADNDNIIMRATIRWMESNHDVYCKWCAERGQFSVWKSQVNLAPAPVPYWMQEDTSYDPYLEMEV